MAQTDKDVRLELSALYRILHIYGMTDLANQCAGARSAEDMNCSFVHPYGMFYEEITASSLVAPFFTIGSTEDGLFPKILYTLLISIFDMM